MQLLVKRSQPEVVFFAVDTPEGCDAIREAYEGASEAFGDSRKVVFAPAAVANDPNVPWEQLLGFKPDHLDLSPYNHETITRLMGELSTLDHLEVISDDASESAPVAVPPVVIPASDAQATETLS